MASHRIVSAVLSCFGLYCVFWCFDCIVFSQDVWIVFYFLVFGLYCVVLSRFVLFVFCLCCVEQGCCASVVSCCVVLVRCCVIVVCYCYCVVFGFLKG